jgi:hypothetical protein
MSLARVLARLRSGGGRAYVLGVLLALLTLVPLVHTSPPDAMWIAGVYDASDFDEVVWTLIGADTVGPSEQPKGAPLPPVNVLTRVAVFSVVAIVGSALRPRSPPRI